MLACERYEPTYIAFFAVITKINKLKKGETIIDLGSGAGFDVFLAARKVGSTGRAIGVDMNKVWCA